MPETPDLKALAERYLDLWEEQFAATASDPALAAAMTTWLGPWRAFAGGAAPGATADAVRTGHDGGGSPNTATAGVAPRPAPAAPAPGDGGSGLDGLLERLDRIERRLDALERKRKGKGGRAGARPARGRTRRAG